jgi:hypothetical protein
LIRGLILICDDINLGTKKVKSDAYPYDICLRLCDTGPHNESHSFVILDSRRIQMKKTTKLVLNQETLKNLTEHRQIGAVPLTSNYSNAEPCCVCTAPDMKNF